MTEPGAPTLGPTTVTVDLGQRSYDILIGRGVIDRAGAEIAVRLPNARAAIVTDENVARLHLESLTASLAAADVEHVTVTVPPGEETKSLANLGKVIDALLAARVERADLVVAFGGGVVGDLAGFAAAVFRRGVRLVQVPTTLLAQVDAAVGGKTAVNTPRGKNLVGVFYQPSLVLSDSGILDSLVARIFNAGYAEVVKYGLIDDAKFFTWLEDNWRAIAAGWPEREEAIAVSCRSKARAVAADERDEGVRALLNFGHTFGHALEAATGYSDRLYHGEAVAIGMVLAHEFSALRGLSPAADTARLIAHLTEVGLPTRLADIPGEAPSADVLMEHIAQDKKVTRGQLNLILTHGIGQAFVARDVPGADLEAFLAEKHAS